MAIERRRWESNPLETALQAAAVPSGSSAMSFSVLARSRTWSSTFAGSRAIRHTPRTCFISVPRRGIEPRPAVSKTAMLIRHTRRASFKCLDQDSNLDLDLRRVLCDPLHHRDIQHPDLESNQGQGFRKALCDPLHHRDKLRADDWICTSIERFTRPPPFSVEPRRQQAGVQGFEPRRRLWRPLALPGGHSCIGPGLATGALA